MAEKISSEAGALLLEATDRVIALVKRFAGCLGMRVARS